MAGSDEPSWDRQGRHRGTKAAPLVIMHGDSRQAVIVSRLKSQSHAAFPLQKKNILQCFDFVIMVKK